MRTKYEDYVERKRREYGTKFDASDLVPRFIEHFNSGARIEVEIYGEVKRGRVGITTGWKPVFLLMLTRRSIGSSYVISEQTKFIRRVTA